MSAYPFGVACVEYSCEVRSFPTLQGSDLVTLQPTISFGKGRHGPTDIRGAHLDLDSQAALPRRTLGPARFLFSTMYSTAEEEQQGEPPTPPAYRRPPAQRRWMYLNAHERAPASMKRRHVGLRAPAAEGGIIGGGLPPADRNPTP